MPTLVVVFPGTMFSAKCCICQDAVGKTKVAQCIPVWKGFIIWKQMFKNFWKGLSVKVRKTSCRNPLQMTRIRVFSLSDDYKRPKVNGRTSRSPSAKTWGPAQLCTAAMGRYWLPALLCHLKLGWEFILESQWDSEKHGFLACSLHNIWGSW